jgi:predicted membrane-bound spermidine synthase
MEEPTPRPSSAVLIAVFAVAVSVLAYEVALTRAFSVLLRFHFVFLAVSLATCGLGIGGLVDFLTARREASRLWTHRTLVLRACGIAICYPLSAYLLFATKLSAHLTSIFVVSVVCLPPFLIAGTFLSRAFAAFSSEGGRLYAADLTGAALGSFLVIGALQLCGGINALALCSVVVALGAVWLAKEAGGGRVILPAALAVLVSLALAGNLRYKTVDLPAMPLSADPNAKPLYKELADPLVRAKIVDSDWNAFARTDVIAYPNPQTGKVDPNDDLYIYTDGEVPTNMIHFTGDLGPLTGRLASFIGFYPFWNFRPEKALLIGPGGGLDILLAFGVGAKQIDGAELNPSIPRIVSRYASFNGHVYDYANVNIHVDEGRSFIRRSNEKYDLVYMALTKTATTASSSLALVESYIHTTEAFRDIYDHLTDRGAMAFVCQEPVLLARAMLTGIDAIQSTGVPRKDAVRSVLGLSVTRDKMMLGPYRHLMVMTRQPLSPERSAQLAKMAVATGFEPVFFPGAFEPEPFQWLTRDGVDSRTFVERWNDAEGLQPGERINFAPCPDDRPFVVDLSFGVPPQFRWLLAGVALATILLSVGAWAFARSTGQPGLGLGPLAQAVAYFSLLGIGFMLVEIVLTQKLVLYLGYPVLTLSVILFSLLLGGGLGSRISQRWDASVVRGPAMLAAFAVAACSLVLLLVLPHLIGATLGWDIRLRCAVTMALLAPTGLFMGMPFPSGLRILGARAPELIPWMWGVNGLTSVIGSVGAMVLAKETGFTVVLMVGAGLYVVAGALMAEMGKHRTSPG